MEKKKLNLDNQYINLTKEMLISEHLESLLEPLDKLVLYVRTSFEDIEKKLLIGNLKKEEEKEYIDMLLIMERKFKHILQVIEIANNLALVKGYENYQRITNILVAILHDIGRCMEIHKVGTRMGIEKVNHTQLGLAYLFNEPREQERLHEYLSPDLYNSYREAIYNGIKYHGVKDVPYHTMSPYIRTTVEDIRDADKLAIMSSYVDKETDMKTVFHIDMQELARLPIADLTVHELLNHEQVNRNNPSVPYDRLREFFSHISFIFDINCPLIYDYLYYSNWLERYVSLVKPYMTSDNLSKLEKIEKSCQEYLESKITGNPDAMSIGYKKYQKK